MSGQDHLNPYQFTAGHNYDRRKLQEDLSMVEAFGPRRAREMDIRHKHVQRQIQRHGFNYNRVLDTRRQVNVVNRALDEGVIEDWGGTIDEDTGDMVAISDFTRGKRPLRDFEFLPETYDEAIDGLIAKRRKS